MVIVNSADIAVLLVFGLGLFACCLGCRFGLFACMVPCGLTLLVCCLRWFVWFTCVAIWVCFGYGFSCFAVCVLGFGWEFWFCGCDLVAI